MGKGLKLCVYACIFVLLASCSAKRTTIQTHEKITADAKYLGSTEVVKNVNEYNYHLLRNIETTISVDSSYWVIYDTSAPKDENGKHPILAEGGNVSRKRGEAKVEEADSSSFHQADTIIVKQAAEVHTTVEVEKKEKKYTVPANEAILILCIIIALGALIYKIKS